MKHETLRACWPSGNSAAQRASAVQPVGEGRGYECVFREVSGNPDFESMMMGKIDKHVRGGRRELSQAYDNP